MAKSNSIVHDAEYYILYDQHGERWEVEDRELDSKLEELRKKFGTPPNIIHIMWDDMPFGDAGIPAINKIRGFETPNCNRIAEEGILFTRFYTEPACTPSRAAVITGRHPVRYGMHTVAFPIENGGLRGDEVTTAEVLSKAGYATAFYGKWHLGDIEESYPHNQGFDEALFTPYNQVMSLWNPQGEGANAVLGLVEENLKKDPYQLDEHFLPEGWILTIEGRKGEPGREWRGTSIEDYRAIDPECEKRTIAFIRKNAEAKKPFYVAYWPLMIPLMPDPKKETVARSLLSEGFKTVDAFLGTVMAELKRLGIAENTLFVAHADNGPMTHNPPPGMGMAETVFRGGKSDYWEGGIRVAAFAWWPGMIPAGEIVGDMIHETDLYTTFARLGGGLEQIPGDRIVDGLDQTALLINGDTHGRRDYNFVYTGPVLAATIKGRWKRIWVGDHPGLSGAAFYDLYLDHREQFPVLIPLLHTDLAFKRMRLRHEIWKKKYPDKPEKRGVPFTGLANPRPETERLAKPLVRDRSKLPFDPLEYIDFEPPWDDFDREMPGG